MHSHYCRFDTQNGTVRLDICRIESVTKNPLHSKEGVVVVMKSGHEHIILGYKDEEEFINIVIKERKGMLP